MDNKELKTRLLHTVRGDFKLLRKYAEQGLKDMCEVAQRVIEHELWFIWFTFPELGIKKNDLIKRSEILCERCKK